MPCLRCGAPLSGIPAVNALSRYANANICELCGIDEAVNDFVGNILPLTDWFVFKSGRLNLENAAPFDLLTECSFTQLLDDKTNGHPTSEAAYSRSDYDGYRWWTTWFNPHNLHLDSELVQEIDAFQTALFQMEELTSLATMSRFCRQAQRTSDPTEFNLYSETQSFFVWIRMVTRKKDYNLYVHFLLKNTD